MTWHKKAVSKGIQRTRIALLVALLAGLAVFAFHVLGLPFGVVIERSGPGEGNEPVGTPYREGASKIWVEFGD